MEKSVFFIVGRLSVPHKVVYEVILESYPNAKCHFIEKASYVKSHFMYENTMGANVEAIFVGPVPHKTKQTGKSNSMVSEVKIKNSVTPVYKCETYAGILKLTKNSIRMALVCHLLRRRAEEDQKIRNFIALIRYMFPNQTVF